MRVHACKNEAVLYMLRQLDNDDKLRKFYATTTYTWLREEYVQKVTVTVQVHQVILIMFMCIAGPPIGLPKILIFAVICTDSC